jgi:hypothetical protein
MSKKRLRRRSQNKKSRSRNREWMVADQEIRRSNAAVPLPPATQYNRKAKYAGRQFDESY